MQGSIKAYLLESKRAHNPFKGSKKHMTPGMETTTGLGTPGPQTLVRFVRGQTSGKRFVPKNPAESKELLLVKRWAL
ncbi:hypothetical protein TNIN_111571 [Trichonephila inaurata madagascariensis]|uniref:Uncharacterized protein n=1 Tax=Trichonephila inaurata madagascariensis TaxID=2747483 RepID=A0A8X7C1T3_9ARAC|nr:hypothetical protein TNIN_111571 [Trichonephila inaurata madagascariensis]